MLTFTNAVGKQKYLGVMATVLHVITQSCTVKFSSNPNISFSIQSGGKKSNDFVGPIHAARIIPPMTRTCTVKQTPEKCFSAQRQYYCPHNYVNDAFQKALFM